ncbi:hypothetical protein [Leptobacterium sp. I13]|uniref:hypothetical protein n=1 Tax=Leptobacterium meishanense TaxID=3128904 RepID=UPI0030EE0F1A
MYRGIKIAVLIIGALSIVLWFLLLGSTDPYSDLMINIAKYLVIITAAVVLLFTLKNLVSHPDKLKKALIAVVGFLIVVGIGYALADGEATDTTSASASKWVGTGLYTFYVLTFIAIGAMVVSGIKKTLTK